MLESVFVIIDVIIVIVGIGKEIFTHGKNILGTYVQFGQKNILRIIDGENILVRIVEVFANLVS